MSTVNVLRWSALVSGVFYAVYHQQDVQARYDAKVAKGLHHHQEELLIKAKKAFEESKNQGKQTGPISDPEDPKFDLEALVNWATGEKA